MIFHVVERHWMHRPISPIDADADSDVCDRRPCRKAKRPTDRPVIGIYSPAKNQYSRSGAGER
jgi:hypothetical protein